MIIYLDNCCLSRPYDDLSQDRIKLEADAVIVIIALISRGTLKCVISDVLEIEASAGESSIRQDAALEFFKHSCASIRSSELNHVRVDVLLRNGFKKMDAYHLAAAESGECDFLITTDDRLLKRARLSGTPLKVKVVDPIAFLRGIMPL